VSNKGVSDECTRISTYNSIQEKKIIKNMFLPVKFNVSGINLGSQIIDSKYLRNTIYINLMKQFELEYKNGASIKSNYDIGRLVHSPELYKIFNSVVIEQYDIYTFKNKENISEFPFSETLKTFLAQLDNISTNFSKNIHDEFTSFRIDKSVYSNADRKKEYFTIMFSNILKTVLKKLITNKSNIYQSLIYKTNLLRLSVV
jgi:hypothetical protein